MVLHRKFTYKEDLEDRWTLDWHLLRLPKPTVDLVMRYEERCIHELYDAMQPHFLLKRDDPREKYHVPLMHRELCSPCVAALNNYQARFKMALGIYILDRRYGTYHRDTPCLEDPVPLPLSPTPPPTPPSRTAASLATNDDDIVDYYEDCFAPPAEDEEGEVLDHMADVSEEET